MVAILADQHMGQQAGTCEPLCDRPLGRRRLVDRAAGAAAVFGAANAQHAQTRRYIIQHFADRLANLMDRATTAGTGTGVDVQRHILARQMIGQARTIIRYAAGLLLFAGRFRRQIGLRAGNIGVEIFEPEGELIGIEALGLASEPGALKLLDNTLEAFDFVIAGLDDDRHIAHQAVQKADVGRQVLKIETHERV